MALAAEKHLLSLDLFEVLYESIHLIAVDDCLFVCLLDTGVLRECCLDDTEDCTLFR